MQQIYKLFLFILSLFVSSNLYSESVLTFEVRGFSTEDWSSSKTLISSDERSEVTVTFSRYTFEQADNIWVGGSFYPSYDYLKLSDPSNESVHNAENDLSLSSYIEFYIPEGKDPVTKVELIGYSFGADNEFDHCGLIESFSISDNEPSSYNLNNPVDGFNPWGTELFILGSPVDVIGNDNSSTYVIGRDEDYDGVVDGIPYETKDDLSSIRYIRYNWSSRDFGGVSSMGRGRPLALFGFNIYTDSDMAVSLAGDQSEILSYRCLGDVYTFTESVSIEVYHVSGMKVLSCPSALDFDISSFEPGFYFFRAVSQSDQSKSITGKFRK